MIIEWTIIVTEDDDYYYYTFSTWAEVLVKLATFDGLAIEYSIFRRKVSSSSKDQPPWPFVLDS